MLPLVPVDSHIAIVAVLFSVVAGAMYLEANYEWAGNVSAAVLCLFTGLALSNARVLPFTAPAYTFVNTYFVIVAIPLVLFKGNLKTIFAESGPTLFAYGLAVGGTVMGVGVAYFLISTPDAPKFAGTITGAYTGGSLNLVAVAQAVGLDDPASGAAALAAATLTGIAYMVFLAWLPSLPWVRRSFPLKNTDSQAVRPGPGESGTSQSVEGLGPDEDRPAMNRPLHMTAALALSLAICAVGSALAHQIGRPGFAILFITALAIVAANIAPTKVGRLEGDFELGMILLYVFFVVFSAGADIIALAGAAKTMLLFTVLVVTIHFLVVAAGAKVFRFSYAEAITATNACVLGPPTAAALAASRGWHGLVTPGILCGVLGYIIGTFLGVTVYAWLA